MRVKEAEGCCGSHHHGPLPIGLPDDGFGNAMFRQSHVFDTVVGIGAPQKIDFIFSYTH